MWTYWALQEGTLGVDPAEFTDNRGGQPPVIHIDSAAPLHDDIDGRLITGKMWGIYFKPDAGFGGVQGGTAPYIVDRPAESVAVDPYGPASPEYTVGEDFVRLWISTGPSRRAASARSHRTASRSSTRSARTPMSSPTPTTATR
jgi:hypothetical protein